MTFAGGLARLNAVNPSQLGEPVTLPDGAIVDGVFDLRVPAAGPLGSDVGQTLKIGHQDNPSILFRSTDVTALAKGDQVSVRGVAYLITDILPDGRGMTAVDLMPVTAADTDAARGLHRWQ